MIMKINDAKHFACNTLIIYTRGHHDGIEVAGNVSIKHR